MCSGGCAFLWHSGCDAAGHWATCGGWTQTQRDLCPSSGWRSGSLAFKLPSGQPLHSPVSVRKRQHSGVCMQTYTRRQPKRHATLQRPWPESIQAHPCQNRANSTPVLLTVALQTSKIQLEADCSKPHTCWFKTGLHWLVLSALTTAALLRIQAPETKSTLTSPLGPVALPPSFPCNYGWGRNTGERWWGALGNRFDSIYNHVFPDLVLTV